MSATVKSGRSYRVGVGDELDRWPDAGRSLLDELAVARGRIALIDAPTQAASDLLVGRLCDDLGVAAASVGAALAGSPRPPAIEDVEAACEGATIVTDVDVLLWPALRVPLLTFLRNRSRRGPTIAVWPGDVAGGRARYSAPGRPDHHDLALRDAVVLRPRPVRFPDEVPFEIERILP